MKKKTPHILAEVISDIDDTVKVTEVFLGKARLTGLGGNSKKCTLGAS